MEKQAGGQNKSSVRRGRRVLKGFRRAEVMLTPEANRALKKLTQGGLSVTAAICASLIEAARLKR